MAFLRRLGREHDAVATIKQGSLIFLPVGAGETPSGKAPASDPDRAAQRRPARLPRREARGSRGRVRAMARSRRGEAENRDGRQGCKAPRNWSRVYASEAEANDSRESRKGPRRAPAGDVVAQSRSRKAGHFPSRKPRSRASRNRSTRRHLVGSGSDPHLFQPRPADVAQAGKRPWSSLSCGLPVQPPLAARPMCFPPRLAA